jgi:hypothetical protein
VAENMVPELLHQEIAQNLVDWAANNAVESVSYTHLTLPTID